MAKKATKKAVAKPKEEVVKPTVQKTTNSTGSVISTKDPLNEDTTILNRWPTEEEKKSLSEK